MVIGTGEIKIPFNGKFGLKDGKIIALVFEDSLTEKQHEYLQEWWKQNWENWKGMLRGEY